MGFEAKNAEWGRIEADYRAGIKSNVGIANDYGVTEGAVRKRAKKEKWVKDLRAQIQAKADSLVRAQAVREEVRIAHKVSDKEIIDSNAQMQADTIVSHRQDIQRNRTLSQKLLAEIEFTTDNIELFEQLGELLIDTSDDKNKAAYKRQEALDKVLSTSSRIDSAKKLSEILKTLIGLEREVFGIDQKVTAGEVLEDWLDKLDGRN